MNRSAPEIRKSESQAKFIQDRIAKVESHFGELCTSFAAVNRKNSRVRDKGDELAKAIITYAENESHNHTTKEALTDFAENLSGVQDFRDTEILRIEDKVIGPLTTYGNACKQAKERLKNAFAARKKEMNKKKDLDKAKDKNPSDRHHISEKETSLQMASVDASRSSRTLEEEMDSFEKKKLQDIKKILADFVNIELLYHAKALEMYTQCFQSLTIMDEDEDLEEFRNSLRPGQTQARLEMQRSVSKTSLNNTMNTTNVSGASSRPTPVAARRGKSSAQPGDTLNSTQPSSTMYSSENGQYEDDDDDEDDDEEEEDSEEDDEDEDEDDEDEEDDEYERRFKKK